MALYFKLFWLPAAVSAVLLVWLWVNRYLTDRTAWRLLAWFAVASVLQGWVNGTAAWVVGLILQTALALMLVLRMRVD